MRTPLEEAAAQYMQSPSVQTYEALCQVAREFVASENAAKPVAEKKPKAARPSKKKD